MAAYKPAIRHIVGPEDTLARQIGAIAAEFQWFSLGDIRAAVGYPRARQRETNQALGRAALGGLYPAYGLVADTLILDREQIVAHIEEFAARGSTSSDAFGVSSMLGWLVTVSSADMTTAKKMSAPPPTMLQTPEVIGGMTKLALEGIDLERERQQKLAGKRGELAVKLYDVATLLWDKVQTLARRDFDSINPALLKAMAESAHNALKDAQLAAGQATDRVEGFLHEVQEMSTEQLRTFLMHSPVPRPLNERTGIKIKELDMEPEGAPVLDAAFEVRE